MLSVELRAGVVRVFISLLFFVFPVCVLKNSGVGSRVRRRIGGSLRRRWARKLYVADCGKNTLENVSKTLERWDALVRMKEGVFADVKSRTTKWESRCGRIRLRTHLWEEDEEIVNALVEEKERIGQTLE